MIGAAKGSAKFGWCLNSLHRQCIVTSAYGLECPCECEDHGVDKVELGV